MVTVAVLVRVIGDEEVIATQEREREREREAVESEGVSLVSWAVPSILIADVLS